MTAIFYQISRFKKLATHFFVVSKEDFLGGMASIFTHIALSNNSDSSSKTKEQLFPMVFDRFLLPKNWFIFMYGKDGEGHAMDFPISIKPLLQWTKKNPFNSF